MLPAELTNSGMARGTGLGLEMSSRYRLWLRMPLTTLGTTRRRTLLFSWATEATGVDTHSREGKYPGLTPGPENMPGDCPEANAPQPLALPTCSSYTASMAARSALGLWSPMTAPVHLCTS